MQSTRVCVCVHLPILYCRSKHLSKIKNYRKFSSLTHSEKLQILLLAVNNLLSPNRLSCKPIFFQSSSVRDNDVVNVFRFCCCCDGPGLCWIQNIISHNYNESQDQKVHLNFAFCLPQRTQNRDTTTAKKTSNSLLRLVCLHTRLDILCAHAFIIHLSF